MSALDDFRNNPEVAIEKYDFMVDAREGFKATKLPGLTNCEYGGPCTLTEGKAVNGVIRLTVTSGGNDYFFPWVNRGVGEVNVPKASSNGTIVVTGGMNGCSLEVTENGPNLIFYHDADSNRLGVLKAPVGTRKCRVEPKTYMGMINMGENIISKSFGDGSAYFHQLLIVKHGGKWKVFGCGVVIGQGLTTPPKQAFRGSTSKFLASFE
ncbi:MAG TPA: hypothetical protein VHT51_11075 [Micropepsaceae bacterium]|nr:hypothetical protein [Micropepsaceae bacterium]